MYMCAEIHAVYMYVLAPPMREWEGREGGGESERERERGRE
jgi:hypothetical protein